MTVFTFSWALRDVKLRICTVQRNIVIEHTGISVPIFVIRERSIPDAGYASLDATVASNLIDKERQLELAYQAERSYDVFRNGKPLVRRYPGPQRQFEDIPATDYRVVYYIPQDAINSYPGTLTQNPTSNWLGYS